MNDIIFQVGDWVRVLPEWCNHHEESPLPAQRRLRVCKPGALRERGEVPIAFDGKVWYVPAAYVEAV